MFETNIVAFFAKSLLAQSQNVAYFKAIAHVPHLRSLKQMVLMKKD